MLFSLKENFGFDTFRYPQEKIIRHTQKNYDQLVVLPTGSGKSICFQLPAIMSKGITIIISPLKSLIKDQVHNLRKKGIKVMSFYGDTPNKEKLEIKNEMAALTHSCHLIYTTPETIEKNEEFQRCLHMLEFRNFLDRFVIDEAHCISHWGNNFRPSYRALEKIRTIWPSVPIMALTATAPPSVQSDIVKLLKFKQYKLYTKSYFRKNLKIRILNKKSTSKEHNRHLADLIVASEFDKVSGIIYCQTRKKCEKLQAYLQEKGIVSRAYHAGLKKKDRDAAETLWRNNQINIIIATIAFGMGIDKGDVRFVIHNDIPFSIESYYQEIGRAGRDGLTSYCILYYSEKDRVAAKKLIKYSYVNGLKYKTNKTEILNHKDNLKHTISLLDKFEDFCLTHTCRHQGISDYLGEKNLESCESSCDNCIRNKGLMTINITPIANNIITIIKDLRSSAYKTNILKSFKNKWVNTYIIKYKTKKYVLELFEKTFIYLRRNKFIQERVIKLQSVHSYMSVYFLYSKSKQILDNNISIDIKF